MNAWAREMESDGDDKEAAAAVEPEMETSDTEHKTDPDTERDEVRDEAKSRKRGRPRKTQNEQEVRIDMRDATKSREFLDMKKQLDLLTKDNNNITKSLREAESLLLDKETELERARSLLEEKEKDCEELIKEISSQDTVIAGRKKPQGLILADAVTKVIANPKTLNADVSWTAKMMDLEEVSSLRRSGSLDTTDIILLMIGSRDIQNGTGDSVVFGRIKEILLDLSKIATVYITSLPPCINNSIQINLFNHRLGNFKPPNDRIKIINITPRGLRVELVDDNGLTGKCVDAFAATINGAITVPEKIKAEIHPEGSSITPSAKPFNLTAVVPVKAALIGKVIGKGGNVIKKLTEKCNVRMSIGKWCEPNKKNKDEFSEAFDGVLISGLSTNVENAIEMVRKITDDDTSDAPDNK